MDDVHLSEKARPSSQAPVSGEIVGGAYVDRARDTEQQAIRTNMAKTLLEAAEAVASEENSVALGGWNVDSCGQTCEAKRRPRFDAVLAQERASTVCHRIPSTDVPMVKAPLALSLK